MRLAPRDPWKPLALANWSLIEIFNDNHEEVVRHAREALGLNPSLVVALRALVSALALSGDKAGAAAMVRLENLEPSGFD